MQDGNLQSEHLEKIRKLIRCYNKMYQLASEAGASSYYCDQILDAALESAQKGYQIAASKNDPKLMDEFKGHCDSMYQFLHQHSRKV